MSVDNQRVLSADRHCWKLWNVATGRELFDVDRLDGFCSSKLTFSRDLTRVALTETDGTITLWNT
jgi:WD40 repeat protein